VKGSDRDMFKIKLTAAGFTQLFTCCRLWRHETDHSRPVVQMCIMYEALPSHRFCTFIYLWFGVGIILLL
jgi:hypothetical protein